MAAFLIAYDVAHPRRLRRVARALERRAMRCQYSVFVFRGDETALAALMEDLGRLIRPAEDVVQAWQIVSGDTARPFAVGSIRPARSAAVVVADHATRLVGRAPESHTPSTEEPTS